MSNRPPKLVFDFIAYLIPHPFWGAFLRRGSADYGCAKSEFSPFRPSFWSSTAQRNSSSRQGFSLRKLSPSCCLDRLGSRQMSSVYEPAKHESAKPSRKYSPPPKNLLRANARYPTFVVKMKASEYTLRSIRELRKESSSSSSSSSSGELDWESPDSSPPSSNQLGSASKDSWRRSRRSASASSVELSLPLKPRKKPPPRPPRGSLERVAFPEQTVTQASVQPQERPPRPPRPPRTERSALPRRCSEESRRGVAVFDFVPTEGARQLLRLQRGDEVELRARVGAWFTGTNLRTGESGKFPAVRSPPLSLQRPSLTATLTCRQPYVTIRHHPVLCN